jgi:hypothetical protein
MKYLLCTVAMLMMTVSSSAATSQGVNDNTVTLYCSQSFQEPEESVKQELPVDKKGYITIFDGQSFAGWRGYGKSNIPSKWKVEDGCIKFDSQAEGEGGDIIFAHKFKNFELTMEWKISKGGNSGIFYLAQETTNDKKELEPIYISCPECQVLDNENHPDAKLGVDGNRKAGSLYDMIPAKPQNAKPYGEWNKITIRVYNGKVTHIQNGVQVLQYQLWTPEWIDLLQNSKFSEKAWPHAFELLSECGGENREGFIGLQDHGNDVWFRNIKVKILK